MMSLDVYIDGHHAGVLTQVRRDLRFAYSDDYRARRDPTPLSLSIPVRESTHEGDHVRSWIDNLLPDSEETRQGIAAKFDSRSIDPYALLHHIGLDVAGAVQFVPEGGDLNTEGALVEWDQRRIAAEIDRLHADPAAMDEDAEVGHWSLAGQHGKFALARTEGGWAEPTGARASTHIFKVGMTRLRASDIAEFATMRAAATLGLSVADVSLEQFNGRQAVIVKRYDRVMRSSTIRVHQEDLCQALGVRGAQKYEADGGPSLEQAASLLAWRVSPRDLDRSLKEFARLQAFNIVAANTDSHGKNTSLLMRGVDVRLAPAYDLISAALLWEPNKVRYKGKMAMRIGGDYRLARMTDKRLEATAAALGVEADGFISTVARYASQFGDHIDSALTEAVDAGADVSAVDTLRARAEVWGQYLSDELVPKQKNAKLTVRRDSRPMDPFTAAFSDALTGDFEGTKRMEPARPCGAYIARTRSRCVLTAGHSGWPATGHRST